MSGKRKLTAGILLVLLVCNLCFIWGNSLVSRAESHNLSVGVLGFLPPFWQALGLSEEEMVHLLRKAAHFTEFACLGGLSTGLLTLFRKPRVSPVLHLLAGGFLVAAIDETLQIFTGRGSQLQDVWLDFAGFATGLAVVLIVRAIVGKSQPVETPGDNVISFPEERAKREKKVK